MNCSIPRSIRRSLFHRMSHSNLDRLVRRLFADTSGSTAWPNLAEWCYAMVTRPSPSMAPNIFEAFYALDVLSTHAGNRLLMEVAVRGGVDLVGEFGFLSKEDLAVVAYLEHPDVFAAAAHRARQLPTLEEPFVLVAGPSQSFLTIDDIAPRLPVVESTLALWLSTNGRPGRPIVQLRDNRTYVYMDILTYGVPSNGLGLDGDIVTSVAPTEVTILMDRKMRYAAVRSDYGDDIDFYRGLAGIAATGSRDSYWHATMLTIPPLITPETIAEFEHPVPGVEEIRLIEAELGIRAPRDVALGTLDLRDIASASLLASGHRGLAKLTFGLRLASQPHGSIMQVAQPNQLWFDHVAIGPQALQQLQDVRILRV